MDTDKLKRLSMVAEIVGGIAVIITLIILVLEIQGNTRAIQRATYNDISKSINEWRSNLFFNPEVRTMISKLDNGEELSTAEEYIQQGVGRNLYTIYERAFWSNVDGQVGNPEWERIERMICSSKGRFWLPDGAGIFTDRFAEFVESCP